MKVAAVILNDDSLNGVLIGGMFVEKVCEEKHCLFMLTEHDRGYHTGNNLGL